MHSISARTLIRRINRKLAHEGWCLHVTRDRWIYDLGRFHVLDESRVLRHKLDNLDELEKYGRSLECLAAGEVVVSG